MTATNSGHCDLCHHDIPTDELVSHIAVHHPDHYEPFETWPDGAVVVTEDLDPSDFAGPTGTAP